MSRKVLIQIRRGLEANLGTLAEGELGYCTDSKKLYIGTANGNQLIVNSQTVGDMLKAVYDTDNDGKVDMAEVADSVPWTGVTGKPSTYNPSAHEHDIASSVTGKLPSDRLVEPGYMTGSVTPTARPLFDVLRADRTAFLPESQIIIEQSTDAGVTWEDAQVADSAKRKLFTGQRPSITIPLKNGEKSTDCMLRVTITGMRYDVPAGTAETERYNYWNSSHILSTERYFAAQEGWVWVNSNSDRIHLRVEKATGASPDTWKFDREAYLSGWSGGNYFSLSASTFGGGKTQTSNYWNWRFTFRTCSTKYTFDDADLSTIYPSQAQSIYHIKMGGRNIWIYSNNYMYHDHLYNWDEYENAIFPAEIKASTYKNSSGTEVAYTTDLPTKLSQLAKDINFDERYYTETEVDTKLAEKAPASHVGSGGSAHQAATTSVAGFMSASDKSKLNGIEAGANKYVHPSTHSLDMITETTAKKIMTADERTKLAAVEAGANKYTLPTASSTVLGGVKVGSRLTISSGVLSADTQTDNNFTNALKTKLDGIEAGAQVNKVTSVAGKIGAVSLTRSDVGLDNVDNTSDANKPISTAMQTALDDKVSNSRVLTDVPAGAKFTDTVTTINGKTGAIAKADIVALGIPAQDTVYTHPSSHPASIITESTTRRFVSDSEKSTWNAKETTAGAQAKANVAEQNAKAYADSVLPTNLTENEITLGNYRMFYNANTNSLDIEVVA